MQHKQYHPRIRLLDIDGTVLYQPPSLKGIDYVPGDIVQPIPGSLEQVNEWYDKGDLIIFWTARAECYEGLTRQQLDRCGFKYHALLMSKPYSREIHIYDDKQFIFHKVERNQGLSSCSDISESSQ